MIESIKILRVIRVYRHVPKIVYGLIAELIHFLPHPVLGIYDLLDDFLLSRAVRFLGRLVQSVHVERGEWSSGRAGTEPVIDHYRGIYNLFFRRVIRRVPCLERGRICIGRGMIVGDPPGRFAHFLVIKDI